MGLISMTFGRGSGMRLLISLLLAGVAGAGQAAVTPATYSVLSEDQGGWPLILGSVGFMPAPAATARIFVLRAGTAGSAEWPARVEGGRTS